MRSRPSPSSSARRALSRADCSIAWYMMWVASPGLSERAFSSISRATRPLSRLPQLTPMRTARSWRQASSIRVAKRLSLCAPPPTLPGLMRYLASASAQAG